MTYKKQDEERNCPICHAMYIPIQLKFFEGRKLDKMKWDEAIQYLLKKYNYPPIEPEWERKQKDWHEARYNQMERERQQEEARIKQIEEQMKKVAEERGSRLSSGRANSLKCPYCGSNNVRKIGVVSRSVSIGVMGLASSKIGKTRKCGSCGYMW